MRSAALVGAAACAVLLEAWRRHRARAPCAPQKTDALIVIDLQIDYISGGDCVEGQQTTLGAAFPELQANVTGVLGAARKQGAHVIHVRQVDHPARSKWLPWWGELHPGGVGAAASSAAEPWAAEREGEPVFVKHAYDVFNSGETSVDLLAHLRAAGIRRLYFCGLLTKACVMFSANSAFTEGFEVCVLGDCCADRTRAHHEAALELYGGYHVRVVNARDGLVFR